MTNLAAVNKRSMTASYGPRGAESEHQGTRLVIQADSDSVAARNANQFRLQFPSCLKVLNLNSRKSQFDAHWAAQVETAALHADQRGS